MGFREYFSLRQFKREWNRENLQLFGFYFVIAIFTNFFLEVLARHSLTETIAFVGTHPMAFFFGALIILLTFSVTLLFRRRVFTFLFVITIWLGVAIANFVGLTYRSMPLTAQDIFLVSSVRDIIGMYLSPALLVLVMVGISALLGGILACWRLAKKYVRCALFGCCCTLIVLLLVIFLGDAFRSAGYLESSEVYGNLPDGYARNGFAYSFSASLVTEGVDEPEDYSPDGIDAIIDEQRELPKSEENTPNIVFVQLESFFDPAYLKDVTLLENPVPNFQALRETCSSGLLSAPCIGAGTANTEFEILTGMNLSHFGVGEYPYMTIVGDDASESVAFALKELGYSTHALHNNNGTFYNRHIVYANLGFDTFTSIEYMNGVEYNPRGWADDSVLVGEIRKSLESSQEKDFVFAVAVQPHGKYPTDPIDGAPVIAAYGMADEGRRNGFEYYLYQLKLCDEFVGELVADLATYEEPTVVVFYGDHLPSFNFQREELSYGDTQTTEYVIWSNYEITPADRDLQTYQLAAYVMQICGIHEGSVFGVHQSYGFASDDDEDYQQALRTLEYDMIYGEQYYLDGGQRPQPSAMRFDVEDVTLDQVEQTDSGLIVRGTCFTPFSVVYLGGDPCQTEYISREELLVPDTVLSDGDEIFVAQISGSDSLHILSQTDTVTASLAE